MRRVNPFKGLGVALATPFGKDGNIDFERLTTLTQSLIEGGADFICVLGTTAETPCLTEQEKRAVIQTVQAVNQGRLPLLLGIGTNCTATVTAALKTGDFTGIDGVLVVVPYYNKPSQEGLYRHFKAVAEASPLPVMLYNVPGRTGVNMTAATTLRIAHEMPQVVAIKEASGNIGQIEEIVKNAPEGFDVISGDDAITFELLTIGAQGVISVIGNAYPALFGEMVHCALRGDYNRALALHRHLNTCFKLLSADGNPAGIKALLAAQGKAENIVRLPLAPACTATCEALAQFDAQCGQGI